MPHDNRTLMSAIQDLRRQHETHPECFDGRDAKALEGLSADTHWLLSEAYRGPMNDPRHHQVYDRIHATLKRLEQKQAERLGGRAH